MEEIYQSMRRWLVNSNAAEGQIATIPNKIDLIRALPFIALHVSCLFVYWVGFSWAAFLAALILCYLRVFSIGAFYHRYFSHRTYKTNRFWQFIFALLGASALQRGPLWWATHHRRHHAVADQPQDVHSPLHHSFIWSHMAWFLSRRNYYYDSKQVADLAKYPELVFLDRYDAFIPLIYASAVFLAGIFLEKNFPSWKTNGWQMLVWCFSISTIALFHITVSINSFAHKYGSRAFNTKDNSRNNFLLALLTLGEGWHNNHHYYPGSAKQGIHFWQIDITYYVLLLFEKLGIIWDLKRHQKTT